MNRLCLVSRPAAAASVSTTYTSTSECSVASPRAALPVSTMPRRDARVLASQHLVERRLRFPAEAHRSRLWWVITTSPERVTS